MRKDMAKVIVERPRWGGGAKYPRAARRSESHRPIEDAVRRESAKRPWLIEGHGQKFLNENLAPLRRFLGSRVGRPWDKVYSEICERINRDSAVQLHIWQHLVDYVCTNPHVVAGEVNACRQSIRSFEFFVDPKCGLLRENLSCSRRNRLRRTQPPRTERGWLERDDRSCYAPLEGVWYELTLTPHTSDPAWVYDHARRREVHSGDTTAWLFRGRRVYVSAKRQLGKHEIRRAGLPGLSDLNVTEV